MTKIYIDKQIAALRELHRDTLKLDLRGISIRDFLARQSSTLRTAHAQGNHAVIFHLACWCQELLGNSAEDIMAQSLSIEDIRLSVAREHGFNDWADVEALGESGFDTEFEHAVDSVVSGDVATLSKLLEMRPQLIRQSSQYAHAATLLHYIGANGVESHRQVVPMNAVIITKILIDAGADVNAAANMYGGGSRVLGLLLSSAHPANANVTEEIARFLEQAGAN